MSAETRRKIERIIEETGYTPNAMARSLAKQESRIISLVIPYIGDVFTFNYNPYYAELIAELEKYVRDRSYCLMIRCVERCDAIVQEVNEAIDAEFDRLYPGQEPAHYATGIESRTMFRHADEFQVGDRHSEDA